MRRLARAGPRPRRRAERRHTRQGRRGHPARHAEGEGCGHVGAVDASAPGHRHRLRGRGHRAGVVPPPAPPRWPGRDRPLVRRSGARVACSRPSGIGRRRGGGNTPRLCAGRAARPAIGRPHRGRRRCTGSPRTWPRHGDEVAQQRVGGGHRDRRGAGEHADGAPRAEPGSRTEEVPAQARGHGQGARTRPPPADAPRPVTVAPPPHFARRAVGSRGRGATQRRHVP